MKYGFVLPIWRLSVADAETLTLRAEELSLEGIFTPDHILAPAATTTHYGPCWPDPFALLAYLAGRTSRIMMGSSVVVLPYRHPLVAAKGAATVDQVSGGRYIFGIGVGWDTEEFEDLGLPFRDRGRMSDEYLRIIKTAWTNDVPSFEGDFLRFSGATFAPRPVQQPHPPIWAGGSPGRVSGPAVRRVAALCDAWHPLSLSLDQVEQGYTMVREAARQQGRDEAVGLAPRNMLNLVDGGTGGERMSFQGTPGEVVGDIRRAQSMGASWMVFDFPRLNVPGMLALMERFVSEVRPAV